MIYFITCILPTLFGKSQIFSYHPGQRTRCKFIPCVWTLFRVNVRKDGGDSIKSDVVRRNGLGDSCDIVNSFVKPVLGWSPGMSSLSRLSTDCPTLSDLTSILEERTWKRHTMTDDNYARMPLKYT